MLTRIVRLRATGSVPGTTKDWEAYIYHDRYEILWGRTGSTLQKREYYTHKPVIEALKKADMKRATGYWLIQDSWPSHAQKIPKEPFPPPQASPCSALTEWALQRDPDWVD